MSSLVNETTDLNDSLGMPVDIKTKVNRGITEPRQLTGSESNLVRQADHHSHSRDFHGGGSHAHHRVTSREAWDAARARWMQNGFDWPVVIWLSLIHIGALVAPFFFSWTGLAIMLVLHWLTGGIGVCLGYHRMLTHGSFKSRGWVRYTLAAIGGLSGEGSALHWVANHRKHHAHSDHEGDPHSPLDGPWWSHIFWTTAKRTPEEIEELHGRWIPDIKDDKGLILLHQLFLPTHIGLGLLLMALGLWIGGAYMATSLVFWGMFLRLAFVLHSTWFVNSASHMWGYRNYETTDESRNNWWVALLTYGEGWHNNHHAYPRMARHGHKWWEFDATFITIRLMEKLGWATDVVDDQHKKKDELNTIRKKTPSIDTESILRAHYPKLQKPESAPQRSDNLRRVS